MDAPKGKFTQDDVIDVALARFGEALKNRHALMRQVAQDWYDRADNPVSAQAFDNANGLVEIAFRQLCSAAEWEPNIPKPKRAGALSEAYYLQEMIRTLPRPEFERLVLGEWTPPAQPGGEG